MRLVLASNNPGKLRELQSLLDGLGIELVAQGELGVGEAAEPHATFVENALAKARHAARAANGAAIADDSGLVVDALAGAPGVASAHFASLSGTFADRESLRRAQDAANNALLLDRLHASTDRRARFVSTLVAVRHADDPEPLIATGRWPAEIAREPRGRRRLRLRPAGLHRLARQVRRRARRGDQERPQPVRTPGGTSGPAPLIRERLGLGWDRHGPCRPERSKGYRGRPDPSLRSG